MSAVPPATDPTPAAGVEPTYHRWGVRYPLDLKNDLHLPGRGDPAGAAAAYLAGRLQRTAARWGLAPPVVLIEVGVGSEGPEVRAHFDVMCPTPSLVHPGGCVVCRAAGAPR